MQLEYTVATPRVKGRGEAWLAWESSLLKLYAGGKKRPANNFWKMWKKLKLDIYNVINIKEFTGVVELEGLDGSVVTINLLEKPKRHFGGLHRNDLTRSVKIKDEYPELQIAQAFMIRRDNGLVNSYENMVLLAKFPILLESEYVQFTLNTAEIRLMIEIAEETNTTPGMTVWTADGPEHRELNQNRFYNYVGHYFDGVLGDTLQGLLNGLEYHDKLNPLGDTLNEN